MKLPEIGTMIYDLSRNIEAEIVLLLDIDGERTTIPADAITYVAKTPRGAFLSGFCDEIFQPTLH